MSFSVQFNITRAMCFKFNTLDSDASLLRHGCAAGWLSAPWRALRSTCTRGKSDWVLHDFSCDSATRTSQYRAREDIEYICSHLQQTQFIALFYWGQNMSMIILFVWEIDTNQTHGRIVATFLFSFTSSSLFRTDNILTQCFYTFSKNIL